MLTKSNRAKGLTASILCCFYSHWSRHHNWSLGPTEDNKALQWAAGKSLSTDWATCPPKDKKAIRDRCLSGKVKPGDRETNNNKNNRKQQRLNLNSYWMAQKGKSGTYPGCLWDAERSWCHLWGDKNRKNHEHQTQWSIFLFVVCFWQHKQLADGPKWAEASFTIFNILLEMKAVNIMV